MTGVRPVEDTLLGVEKGAPKNGSNLPGWQGDTKDGKEATRLDGKSLLGRTSASSGLKDE